MALNDAQSLNQHRRGALLFFKVIRHISRSQGTKKLLILTQIRRFQTVTSVCIDTWQWNDVQSFMLLRRGALLFFKVIHQIPRSQGLKKSLILTQIGRFRTVTPVWIHPWLWNNAQSLRQHRRGALLLFKVICQMSRSRWTNKWLNLTQIECFRTLTPVCIHWWLWDGAQSLKQQGIDALLFFKVTHQVSRSRKNKKSQIFTQIGRFRTVTSVCIDIWQWNDAQSLI